MASLKITKKHHKHLNNPFPSNPKALPFINGNLIFNSHSIPCQQIYDIGNSFQLNWSSKNGGFLRIFHKSQPSRSIWSTVAGRSFVSAAVAETEIEESRGSFLIKDKDVNLICNHQTIENIRTIDRSDIVLHADNQEFKLPALLITGKIFCTKRMKSNTQSIELMEKLPLAYAKYWMLFDQKNSNQIGFQVRLGKPKVEQRQKLSPRTYGYRAFASKFGRVRRIRVGWSKYFSRKPRGFTTVLPAEEDSVVMKNEDVNDFNRICITYSSEKGERFYGFGEQFSHMDFKGKRVPILVQEQGIGRGDQPITFAANLVSYRAGGDQSTTYAPSPFYMTSKMRSLYLEGYNYSVFDLTKHDSVQIQVYGDMVEGRILHGNSPTELIEHFTETIGRPQKLPDWVISGAVVGLQGGTETVRHIWNELQTHETPVSAFWLQVEQ